VIGRSLLLRVWCPLVIGSPMFAQQADVERERSEYARWLASAPTSPFAATALVAVGSGLSLGPPGSDVPLAGLPGHRITEQNGRLILAGPGGARSLRRGQPVTRGRHTFVVAGTPGRTAVTIYTAPAPPGRKLPGWYDYDAAASTEVTLQPPARPAAVRVLAPDGVEVEAAEAGTVTVTLGGQPTTLSVRRLPGATPEESELEVYFRDRTNGKGTYPAGRFVALVPAAEGRYRLDFNRARNPFCAYSSIYPCPAPWRGNTIPVPVEAGERYGGGGLDPGQVNEQ
jgi:uncharacterized protein (DUF1684 family)